MKRNPLTPQQLEKYHGPREYRNKAAGLKSRCERIYFKEEQKDIMLRDMLEYIIKNDYTLYHDFMDDISVSHVEWFNFLTFDRNSNQYILRIIKSRAASNR